jgi:hypothetical protein
MCRSQTLRPPSENGCPGIAEGKTGKAIRALKRQPSNIVDRHLANNAIR